MSVGEHKKLFEDKEILQAAFWEVGDLLNDSFKNKCTTGLNWCN